MEEPGTDYACEVRLKLPLARTEQEAKEELEQIENAISLCRSLEFEWVSSEIYTY